MNPGDKIRLHGKEHLIQQNALRRNVPEHLEYLLGTVVSITESSLAEASFRIEEDNGEHLWHWSVMDRSYKPLADRYNQGKLEWSLVDYNALEPLVQVLMFGAEKYSRNNWKKGLPFSKICDSMMRHLTAYMKGEYIDPESNLPHVGHIMCNAMFLSYMEQNRKDLDDISKSKQS